MEEQLLGLGGVELGLRCEILVLVLEGLDDSSESIDLHSIYISLSISVSISLRNNTLHNTHLLLPNLLTNLPFFLFNSNNSLFHFFTIVLDIIFHFFHFLSVF